MDSRTVYLMVRDFPGEEVGIEWGVDWGLKEGEELPEDIEDLSDSQYTIWLLIKAIEGVGDDEVREKLVEQAKDRPSGILLPVGK